MSLPPVSSIIALVAPYRKAIVAAAVSGIVAVLAHYGFNADANFTIALTTILTTISVYLVPNDAPPA